MSREQASRPTCSDNQGVFDEAGEGARGEFETAGRVCLCPEPDSLRWRGADPVTGLTTLGAIPRPGSRCEYQISSGGVRRFSASGTIQCVHSNGKPGGGS